MRKFEFDHKDIFLLLGPQEVGKTCFLAGLYYTFRSALNGYSISCIDEEQRLALDLFCKDLERGKFPQGTGGSTKYYFMLRKAHIERFPFEWYDYRGKMLEEYGVDDGAEYNELVNIVTNSTCILICIDGSWLSADKDKTVKTIQDNSFIINEFLNQYIDNNGKLPPICVVITKSDMCEWKYEQAYFEAIKESFPFFENAETPVFICPICIGNKEDENSRFVFNPIDKDIYKPLFFALWCGYSYQISGLKKKYNERKECFDQLIKESELDIKKLNDKVIAFNKNKRIESKKMDIQKWKKFLLCEEERISELEEEQKDLYDKINASEGIFFGINQTTWEEVNEKWRFFQ